MRMRRYGLTRSLENRNGNVSRDAGEIIEELIQRLSTFKVIKKILDGHARTGEDGRTALNLGIDRN
jgi:hypothetical protein